MPRLYGGEGGVRTLGAGVSPYNGLANESFSPPSLVFNHLASWEGLSVGLKGSLSASVVLHFVLHSMERNAAASFHSVNPTETESCYFLYLKKSQVVEMDFCFLMHRGVHTQLQLFST